MDLLPGLDSGVRGLRRSRLAAALFAFTTIILSILGVPLSAGTQGSRGSPSSGSATTEGPGLLFVREWVWRPSFKGDVTALALGRGVVYALLDLGGPSGCVVYALNSTSGEPLWAYKIPAPGRPGGIAVSGRLLYVAVIVDLGNESVVRVYSGSEPPLKLLYTINFTEPLYRILAAQPLPTGEVAVAGARYRFGRSYQYFIALAAGGGVEWSKFWGGRASEFLNTVSVGRDLSICAAGLPGEVACFSQTGEALLNTSLKGGVLALADMASGSALVGGVSNATGFVEALTPRGSLWRRSTGTFIPTSAADLGGLGVLAGVVMPKPYRLGVLLVERNGSVVAFGYSNETYNDLTPLSIIGSDSRIIVGGSADGKPFVESILLVKPSKRPAGGSGASAGEGGRYERLILVEEAALAASAAALAVSLAVLKPWRRHRRGGGSASRP